MKVKVSKWKAPAGHQCTAMDAWFLWFIGKMPGECFERIALKSGQERWLYRPNVHGKYCPSSGDNKGIECRCDNCDFFLNCFPDWREWWRHSAIPSTKPENHSMKPEK